MRRHSGAVAFGAFATLCGIATHLVAELTALGWRADASLVVSPRHAGLAVLATASLLVLGLSAWSVRTAGARGVLRRLRPPADARFVALAFAVQLFVFGCTEFVEGTPLDAGDLGMGLLGALLASAAGAYLVARFHSRVLEALALTFAFLSPALTHGQCASWQRSDAHVRVWRPRALTFSASSRPPPALPAP